ncbi:MAG: bifunctional [glutamine synthetase] adenylyltransferase/[glutamine synthetase]-adenylyl-L-tyrosine phosphorylase, partial [Xanthobacteraceae bacterium]
MKRSAVGKRAKKQRADTALIARLDAELPVSSPAAHAAVTEWLSGVKASTAGKSLRKLCESHPALARVLDGIAETSPYLWDLIRADPARLARLLTSDPDDEFAALLDAAKRKAATARTPAAVMRALRGAKANAALLIALADIGGVWPVPRVTHALTSLAETALGIAVHYLLRDAVKRGRLNARDKSLPEPDSGYIVLAMGKMGGHELNFSSDIDLMVFFDAAGAKLADHI